MASYYWSWSQYSLPAAAEDIGDVYSGLTGALTRAGYANVTHDTEVRANTGDFAIAVVFLFIGGREFWLVANCVTDGAQAAAQTENANLVAIVRQLTFV
jgi:hypothetical protein